MSVAAPRLRSADRSARAKRRHPVGVAAVAAVTAASLLTGCLSSNQAKTLGQMNNDRNRNGLGSLPSNTQAVNKAQAWADHLASIGRLEHTSLGSGYSLRWCSLGENVGYGGSTQDVENAFMASSGHRANILNSGWNRAGTGVARSGNTVYVVQEFVRAC